MKRTRLALLLFISSSLFAQAQNNQRGNAFQSVNPGDAEPPKIAMKTLGNSDVQFTTSLRPLRPIERAPKPFYSYFWEFGDGTFSDVTKDGQKPVHRYKASGNYQVRLYATNNYDNGMAPPAKPQPFSVQVTPAAKVNEKSNFFGKTENIGMKLNSKPKPNEELVAYLGYRNQLRDNLQGSLIIFFNEQKFYRKMFSLGEIRTYHGENKSSLEELSSRLRKYSTRKMLKAFEKQYSESAVLHFDAMPANQERFVFLPLITTPEMIIDTNAVITMTAILVPDDPSLPPESFELESILVSSHDPNRMLLRERRINYRFMKRKKELTYTVQFQNIGEGPAKNISVGIQLPRQLNVASLTIKKVSPGSMSPDSTGDRGQTAVDTVKTADSIHFRFRNIYLPGLKEERIDDDSTKGFVKYAIRFKKRPKKIPFSSRAVIVFDKNEPIYTNFAEARFVKGLSPGVMAGYNFSLSEGNYSAKGPVQIGYVLAPYAPYRPYFQLELHAGVLQQEDLTTTNLIQQDTQLIKDFKLPASLIIDTKNSVRETVIRTKRNILQVVPLHFRYNLNSWISAGLGIMGQLARSEQTSIFVKYDIKGYTTANQNFPDFDTVITRTSSLKSGGQTRSSTTATFAPFADIQVGRVRTGPTLGLRYYRLSEGNLPNRFFLYAGFKL